MRQRAKNSKSEHAAESGRDKAKQKASQDLPTGGRKQRNMPLPSSSRSIRTLSSWSWSFTKLILVIVVFILCVYLYDKNIVYGFAREAGWIAPNADRFEGEAVKLTKDHLGLDSNLDPADEDTVQQNKLTENQGLVTDKESSLRTSSTKKNEMVDGEDERHKQEDRKNTQFAEEDDSDLKPSHYHVLQVLTNTHQKSHLKTRFDICARSILSKSSVNLHFFFVVDKPSEQYITECLQQITDEGISRSHFQFTFLHIEDLGKKLLPHVGDLQAQLRGSHPYYHDAIFFLSLGIHKEILPDNVKQLVIMDTDLKFMSDIKQLFDLFDEFSEDNVMGIAHEQQPVYRHLFSLYRSQNRGTRVGDPPPDGLTGFNSGVMLLDFAKMRSSESYKEVLSIDFVKKYAEKYHFKGHLGDQDFFSLASMEKPELFYVLPCSWNKQLCIWWKDKGYQDVFDLYFNCPEHIHVYHGNCNTPIPY